MPAFHSVRGTEDYLTSRAANPRTGLISPSVYGPSPPATPRTPGEALALRGDFSKTPDQDDRRPSGAEMLNEHFGLGKKKEKFPLLKRRKAGLSKIDDTASLTSSATSSRPNTPQIPGSPLSVDSASRAPDSPRTAFSDTASITSSESNFVVQRPIDKELVQEVPKKTSSNEARAKVKDTLPPRNATPARSGTIMRVAAYWSGVKQALQTTQSGSPQQVHCLLDDDARSEVSDTPSAVKKTTKKLDDLVKLDIKKFDKIGVGSSEVTAQPKDLAHLPSVRLVHPSLAAVPGVDRRADRVVELPDLLKQSNIDEEVDVSKSRSKETSKQKSNAAQVGTSEQPMSRTTGWLLGKLLAILRTLVGPYHIQGISGTGSMLEGVIAMARLLVLAYLLYCSWLVFGLIADVIQAICWPFRVVAQFIEWSMR